MDGYLDWLNARPLATRRVLLATAAIAAVLIAVAVSVIGLGHAAPFLGAAAGATLFAAATGYWHTVLPVERQVETDLKVRYGLRHRRILVGVAALVWFALLLAVGRYLPAALAGTVNVWVVLHLFWLFRATPAEAAEARAVYEAQKATQQAAQQGAGESTTGGAEPEPSPDGQPGAEPGNFDGFSPN